MELKVNNAVAQGRSRPAYLVERGEAITGLRQDEDNPYVRAGDGLMALLEIDEIQAMTLGPDYQAYASNALFPLLGMLTTVTLDGVISPVLATGILFLAALPPTLVAIVALRYL